MEVSSANEGAAGGYKEIICSVTGDNVYGTLKYESGVHRVQRVPATETQGRVHTSAASVAVLPEAEEFDVVINEGEIKWDTFRSGGAYKPNLAFYESMGVKGWIAFEKTVNYIKENYPDQFIIADAKRGDIGNTSAMYARTFFEELDIDSVTVAPYMGEDSVTPFLSYEGKWVILLALTSNKGSHDFQLTEDANGERLFEKVLKKSQEWANDEQMMYVVGATQGRAFEDIRKIVPNHFLLVPGIGAQGGSLEDVCKYGMNSTCGLIVNSSRGIIYVDKTENFAAAARAAAKEVQEQMAEQLKAIL